MNRLSEKMMQVYTSGDSMTVLALLNKLIKTVEDYESEGLDKSLYRHQITLNFIDNGPHYVYFDVYTSSPEPFTLDTLLSSNLGIIVACGYHIKSGNAEWYQVTYVQLGENGQDVSLVNLVRNNSSTTIIIPNTANVFDTVTQIF